MKKIACQHCGEILEIPKIDYDHEFFCPVCNERVYRSGQKLGIIFSLTISALIMFLITISMPLLNTDILDIHRRISIIDLSNILFNKGYYFLDIVFSFTIIIIPILILLNILIILYFSFTKKDLKKINFLFKSFIFFKEWNMSEVYFISFLVAMIKIDNITNMKIDIGLFTIFLYLSLLYLIMIFFNPHDIWHSKVKEF